MAEANESRASSSRANLRETEGLEAILSRDPNEVLRWKNENPLRLVAAALVDIRRPAKKADIGEKLSPAVISPDEWDRWWSRIQPTLKESRHFSQDARYAIRLRAKPSEIEPASRSEPVAASPKTRDDKPRAAPSRSSALRLVDWIDWAQSDEGGSAPRGVPPDGLAAYLRKQPAILVPTSASRLSRAIDEKILAVTPSSRPSPEAWIDLLSISLDRCADLPADRRAPMAETVVFCARLTDELGANACKNVIESLAKWTSASAESVADMANAILLSANRAPRETASLFQQLHDSLGGPARQDLWRRLITSDSGQISGWLNNRWRNMPSDSEKEEIVSSLIMSARDPNSVGDIDSLLSDMWNMAESNLRAHLFNPILMGWILHREMMPKVEGVLQKFAEEIGNHNGQAFDSAADSPHENPIMRQWKETVKAASQNEIGRLRAEHQREIAEKDRLLSVAESEIERVGKGKTFFQEELRKAASATSLKFNRDAIVMLGEWFRDMSSSPLASHRETRGVQEKIEIALLALGAEPFGQIGELVPFDLISHEADPPPQQGDLVKIIAPGVAHVRDEHTPRTMVKVRVKVEERA